VAVDDDGVGAGVHAFAITRVAALASLSRAALVVDGGGRGPSIPLVARAPKESDLALQPAVALLLAGRNAPHSITRPLEPRMKERENVHDPFPLIRQSSRRFPFTAPPDAAAAAVEGSEEGSQVGRSQRRSKKMCS